MAVNINIPSQVKTYANLAAFPASGALKTIYIAEDTNKTYRWTGSIYTEISASAAMTWGAIGGTLSNQTDLQSALDAKVPTSRTITINGVTQDLSADRAYTISTGITIGTTAIASGVVGRVLFQGTGNVVQQSANLFWDDAANRFIIGGSTASNVRANTNEFNIQRDGLTVPTGGSQLMFNLVGNGQGMSITNQNGTTYRIGQFAVANVLTIGVSGNSTLNLFTSGNVGIGTTTDAGFRLDVNGTARVSGNFTLRNVTDELLFANATVKIRRVSDKLSLEGFSGFDFIDTNTAFTRMQIRSTGNVLINTTTDAGYRLDVNGTARVQGTINIGTNVNVGIGSTLNGTTFVNNGPAILYASAGIFSSQVYAHNFYTGNFQSTSGTQGFVNFTGATFNPASGTAVFNTINATPTINQTGGANGITRGLYINPTLTAAADFRAIETTAGNVIFNGGNVGIGASPSASFLLDVNGAGRFQSALTVSTPAGGDAIVATLIGVNAASNQFIEFRNVGTVNARVGGLNAGGLLFQTGTTERARIASTGNVLINTTTDAGFRLDVNGTGRFTGNVTLDQLISNQVRSSFYNTATNSFTVFRAYTATGNAAFYQNVSVGTTSEPVASAVLQADSTTKGFLPPRMTTTQKNAIASPATGLVVYDTTLNKLCVYTTAWETVTSL